MTDWLDLVKSQRQAAKAAPVKAPGRKLGRARRKPEIAPQAKLSLTERYGKLTGAKT